MTQRDYTTTNPEQSLRNTVIAVWTGFLGAADSSNVWAGADYADKTVNAYGDFTGGGSVKLQGTNDPLQAAASWIDLTAVGGGALTFSAPGMKVMAENPYYIRCVPAGTLAGAAIAITGRRVR